MSRATSSRLPIVFAALGPVAIGGILAVRAQVATPLVAVPAIVFGVVAATVPALYIATAAAGAAPPIAHVLRAVVTALGAFGIALVGFVLPAAFLAFTSLAMGTTIVITSIALAGAGVLAVRRLAGELELRSSASFVVFAVWALATFGIAWRLWHDFAWEVVA